MKGERFLKFFPGKTIGPINRLFNYSDRPENAHRNAILAKIKINDSNKSEMFVYLNGGCYFESINNKTCQDLEVLAFYER